MMTSQFATGIFLKLSSSFELTHQKVYNRIVSWLNGGVSCDKDSAAVFSLFSLYHYSFAFMFLMFLNMGIWYSLTKGVFPQIKLCEGAGLFNS